METGRPWHDPVTTQNRGMPGKALRTSAYFGSGTSGVVNRLHVESEKEKSTPRCFPQAVLRVELPLIKMKAPRGTVFREKIRNRLLDWLGLRVTENSKWRCQVQNSQQTCELVKFEILLAT